MDHFITPGTPFTIMATLQDWLRCVGMNGEREFALPLLGGSLVISCGYSKLGSELK